MDNVISLMERLGADSQFNTDVIETLLKQPFESEEIVSAIRDADIAKLEMLLNVRNKIVCMVFPVEEPKEEPNQPDKPDEEDKPENTKTSIAI